MAAIGGATSIPIGIRKVSVGSSRQRMQEHGDRGFRGGGDGDGGGGGGGGGGGARVSLGRDDGRLSYLPMKSDASLLSLLRRICSHSRMSFARILPLLVNVENTHTTNVDLLSYGQTHCFGNS